MSAERKPLILLVDDDADFLEINRLVLEPQGYRVVCCSDPLAAWAQITEEQPDLVITDLMMSNLDSGFSFARRVRSEPQFSKIPIIVATAVSSQLGLDFRPQSAADLTALQVDAYFDKPVRPQALLEKVRELIRPG
jgi:CheY-like chemotaxis protein